LDHGLKGYYIGGAGMKFLVIDRGGSIELSPTEGESLFMQTRDWVRDMMDSGKIEMAYALSGEMASVMIYNVESNEELDDMLQDYPLSNYSVFEIYPLSDALRSFEKAAGVFGMRRQMAA